ncbi:polysaccharide deacetylase family protein [Streptomyces pathocidini]|uniref:polysaccharide deacetylase family protein n=1 Tax=Streptomyces pathocidini TaxID=1650571 RepID=UPI0033D7A294
MARPTPAGRRTSPTASLALAVTSALAALAVVLGALTLASAPGSAARHTPGNVAEPQGRESTEPVGRTGTRRAPEGISHATESGGKAVNITIDDGPDPTWTPRVLDVLASHGAKATFCMIGPQARAHPDLVKRVVAAGHRLCDHTVSHDTGMDHKPVAYQKKEILDAERMIEDAAGGAEVDYYRAPGGAFTPESRKIAAAHGMRPLGWNVDTKDFDLPGEGRILETVRTEIGNGPTILFHDGGGDRSETVGALGDTLAWLKDQGYGFSFPQK